MPKQIIPAIADVKAEKPYVARVTWDNGITAFIDLTDWLNKSRWFAPVLENPAVWSTIRPGGWGGYIEWEGCEMEVPSSTLWRLHLEQAGEAMRREEFEAWMQRHKLSLTRASETLGLSRRMVTYYKTGEKIIPRTVMLACKAVDYEPELRV
ncbi:DUF2442 domain-containing protein [Desulfovibrio subterraneus]|uniref:hypothetical protein n=1 Tax=Desulfovibrio subterraneus TaxID=2718620 RepID=UPI0022B86B03|nr:hypothetical protein [Desulfovibrio subterraneus]WBF67586.1 DUF2442 domain-containing protein [Desulfovibrio subterraneus]